MISKSEALWLVLSAAILGATFASMQLRNDIKIVALPLAPSPVAKSDLVLNSQILTRGTSGDIVFEALDYQCPPCHSQDPNNMLLRAAGGRIWVACNG